MTSTATPSRTLRVPPLQPGDRLTRAEFERRFDATPGLKKAELIEGTVYMAPPVSHQFHSQPHADLLGLLSVYRAATPGVLSGDNGSLRLDLDNMPQPDAYLMIAPDRGGQASIDDEGYVAAAPELVAEVAATTASYDLHDKLRVYQRHRVREYVVWRTFDRQIDFLSLRQGRFVRLPLRQGVYRSKVFPGLWLAPAPLIDGDLAAALAVLQQGLATPEHATFKTKLAGCC